MRPSASLKSKFLGIVFAMCHSSVTRKQKTFRPRQGRKV
jgi:hypothetical protein